MHVHVCITHVNTMININVLRCGHLEVKAINFKDNHSQNHIDSFGNLTQSD